MKLARRRFLSTTLGGWLALGGAPPKKVGQGPSQPASAGLDHRRRESLRAAMDEIIPRRDGMPAASDVGGLEYLERVGLAESEIAADLQQALDSLGRLSESRFRAAFAKLSSPQRVEILSALETDSPEVFGRLRDHVYESYYTQPRVWKLIGYDFYPTNASGPHMKPFDDSLLAKVRKM